MGASSSKKTTQNPGDINSKINNVYGDVAVSNKKCFFGIGNDVCFSTTSVAMLSMIVLSLLAIFVTINFYIKKTYKILTVIDPELGLSQQNEIPDSSNNWDNFTLENNTQSTIKPNTEI